MTYHGRFSLVEAFSLHVAHEGADADGFPNGNLQYFSAEAQPETCATEAAPAEWPARRRSASSRVSAS
jgi:hypothetical protein